MCGGTMALQSELRAMKTQFVARFPDDVVFLNADVAELSCAQRAESINTTQQLMARDPGRLVQTRYQSLAFDYESLALWRYALGYPLDQVGNDFAQSAHYRLKVFELRGSQDAFEAYSLTVNPDFPPGDPRAVAEFKQVNPPGTKDFSNTNSRDNVHAACVALTAREYDLTKKIVTLAYDPPDAKYIHPRSEICRPYDQRLAYALKYVFTEKKDLALQELADIQVGGKQGRPQVVKNVLECIITNNPIAFCYALDDLLNWHTQATFEREPYEIGPGVSKAICFWATGLSYLALHVGLVARGDLPQDNVYFPLDLISPPSSV